jgi:Hypothetical glycosyl hydrolase 6/Beta-galactosidase trimerisation domain
MTRRELLESAAGIGLAAGMAPAMDVSWLKDVYRELHLDAHFGQLQTIYEDFDAESAAQIWKAAGFQMVSYFASCGAGFSYYPTKIGVRHPALTRDFTGEMTAALKKRGMRVLAYVSVGPDRRYSNEHPDWTILPRGGTAQMCISSPWVEEVHIPQLKEILSLYDIDGFFLDNMLGKFVRGPCYCQYCKKAFGAEIPVSDEDPNVFAHHRFLTDKMNRYAQRIIGALTKIKPSLAFVLNHVWVSRNPVNPPAAVTQLVWEPAPPYPGTLSLDFSFEARYLSAAPRIANWSCMTTRGNGWGDYSLRDPIEYRHEAAVLLASGGRPYFGDDSYPSGNPDPAVYQVYGDVNRRTAELEPFVKGRVPVKDIAVLLSADSIWSKLPLTPPRDWMGRPSSPAVAGAHKVLIEEHAAFSILNSETLIETLKDYQALVIAEQTILNQKECDAIRRFVRDGGALLVTGDTGTRDADNKPLADFSLPDVLGIRYVRSVNARRAFLRVPAERMDVQVGGGYAQIETTTARTLIELVPASGSKQAPGGKSEGPGITLNQFGRGRAIYAAPSLFEAYFHDDTSMLRKLAAWMLQSVYPIEARSIVLENAPLNVELAYTSRGRDRFVHLLNYGGDKRIGGAQRVHAFSAVDRIRIRLRCAAKPKRVLLVPENKPVAFEWNNGWASFAAQPLLLDGVYWIES